VGPRRRMVDEKKAIKETEKPSKDDVVSMGKVNFTMSSISLQIIINQILCSPPPRFLTELLSNSVPAVASASR